MQPVIRTARVFFVFYIVFVPSGSLAAGFPPVRLWGELGYDYRLERFDEGEIVNEHVGAFRINGATFIARPWIAQVVAGMGLVFRNIDATTGDSQGRFLNGDITLRVFPFSPFPFNAFVQHRTNEQDSETSDHDTVVTKFGFNQSYTSPRFGAFRLRYDHTAREQRIARDDPELLQKPGESTRDNVDNWLFGYNYNIGRHGIRFDTTHNTTDRGAGREDTSRLFSNLRHNYNTAGTTLSVENRLTYSRDVREGRPSLTVTTPALEFNSIAFWRPRRERPLLVNGFVRIRNSGTQTEISRTESTVASANAGFSYQWRPRWQFSGNASAAGSKSDQGDDFRTLQILRLSYTSRTFKLGRFDYAWSSGPQVANASAKDDDLQSAGLDLGHTLRRNFLLSPRANISFSLRQSGSLIEDSDGRSVQTLRHNGDIAWVGKGPRQTQNARLSFSDTRTFGGGGRQGNEDSEFQLINFQASINRRFGRFSILTGDMTVQASRTVVAGDDETASDREEDGFLPSAAIALTYGHNRVFRVPRLLFRSKLRFFSDSYFPQLDEPSGTRQREQIIWENRLEYAIGRLRLRLLGTLSELNGDERGLLLFQVRRNFGF